jgi:phosphate ABC transporter phosphate-binding protein
MALAVTVLTATSAGWITPAQRAAAASYTTISGSGSTWSAPAINQWQADVHQNGLIVNYNANGSSSGRSDFAQGTTDFGASEIPYGVVDGNLTDPAPTHRGYAYMPDLAGGTTFMYNLTVGTQRIEDLRLSGAVIAGIFTDQITMWNDPKITADNPGLTLPATRIIPVVRADGSGSTAQFTQWMIATEGPYWTAYCAATGWNPCTQTSTYPTLNGSPMIAELGDSGVSGYVAAAGADGAIGYTEYAYAKQSGFPIVKLLNAAGYYTIPTPGNISVSMLNAKINMNTGSPLYLTQDLSQVYTDTDPRTYELSAYSYMILPTTQDFGVSGDKGYSVGEFGKYLLCTGQKEVDPLGYAALPLNLVEAGFTQLAKIPGATVPTDPTSIVNSCAGNNPTFDSNGTNLLVDDDPNPPACDKQGSTMCTTSTVGGGGGGGSSASPSPSASTSASAGSTGAASPSPGASSTGSGSTGSGSPSPGASARSTGSGGTGSGGTGSGSKGPGGTGSGGTGSGGTGSGGTGSGGTGSGGTGSGSTGSGGTGSGGTGSGANCDPNTGVCTAPTGGNGTGNGGTSGGGSNTTLGQTGVTQPLNAVPVSAASSLGDGVQLALMVLAALLLVGLGVGPALIAQASTRRQQRRGTGPYGRRDWP